MSIESAETKTKKGNLHERIIDTISETITGNRSRAMLLAASVLSTMGSQSESTDFDPTQLESDTATATSFEKGDSFSQASEKVSEILQNYSATSQESIAALRSEFLELQDAHTSDSSESFSMESFYHNGKGEYVSAYAPFDYPESAKDVMYNLNRVSVSYSNESAEGSEMWVGMSNHVSLEDIKGETITYSDEPVEKISSAASPDEAIAQALQEAVQQFGVTIETEKETQNNEQLSTADQDSIDEEYTDIIRTSMSHPVKYEVTDVDQSETGGEQDQYTVTLKVYVGSIAE